MCADRVFGACEMESRWIYKMRTCASFARVCACERIISGSSAAPMTQPTAILRRRSPDAARCRVQDSFACPILL